MNNEDLQSCVRQSDRYPIVQWIHPIILIHLLKDEKSAHEIRRSNSAKSIMMDPLPFDVVRYQRRVFYVNLWQLILLRLPAEAAPLGTEKTEDARNNILWSLSGMDMLIVYLCILNSGEYSWTSEIWIVRLRTSTIHISINRRTKYSAALRTNSMPIFIITIRQRSSASECTKRLNIFISPLALSFFVSFFLTRDEREYFHWTKSYPNRRRLD